MQINSYSMFSIQKTSTLIDIKEIILQYLSEIRFLSIFFIPIRFGNMLLQVPQTSLPVLDELIRR